MRDSHLTWQNCLLDYETIATRTLVLTASIARGEAVQALQLGARGVVLKAAASQVAKMNETPVAPATAPVKPREVKFPADYPTTAPSAQPRPNPEFAKGVETRVDFPAVGPKDAIPLEMDLVTVPVTRRVPTEEYG